MFEPIGDSGEREDAAASGGELECEWDAIEAPADLGDGAGVRVGQGEVAANGGVAIDEESHGVRGRDAIRGIAGGVGERERLDGKMALTAEEQGLPAGHEQLQSRDGLEEADDGWSGVAQVLEAIDQDQRRTLADGKPEPIAGVDAGEVEQTERLADLALDCVRIVERGQRDEPAAATEFGLAAKGEFSAILVLPTPPTPVIVMRRTAGSR